ncbi:MAG: VWA domain-containing protein [Phycisphaerae bacterium]|nr:VWA domain-containing protein [Phycisphaerae bacterium]
MIPPVGSSTWGVQPGIDPLFSAGLVAALFLLGVWEWRRGAGAGSLSRFAMRLFAAGLCGAVLMGPGRWIVPMTPDPPEVTVLVDRSRSMGLADRTGCTRLESVKRGWLSDDALARLGAAARLSVIAFDEQAQTIPPGEAATLASDGNRSRVADAVSGVIAQSGRARGSSPAHVLLLSDGIDTDGRMLASLAPGAREAGVRVHAVAPLGIEGEEDVSIEARFAQPWTRTGEPVPLHIDVSAGGSGDETGRIIVREASRDGVIIAERPVTLDARRRVVIDVTPSVEVPRGGITAARYVVQLDRTAGGRAVSESAASIQVVGRRLRILLIEGEPSLDTRAVADALSADAEVELTTVYSLDGVQSRPPPLPGVPRRLRVTRIVPGVDSVTRTVGGAAPTNPEALGEFDLFVVGAGAASILTDEAFAALRRLVEEDGRGLLLLRCDDVPGALGWASPFAGEVNEREMESARIEVRGGVAGDGAIDLWVDSLRMLSGALVPSATAVARADGEPLIVERILGAGWVGGTLGSGLWRGSAADEGSEDSSRRMWAGLCRRLASGGEVPPGAEASLALDRMLASPGEAVRVIVRTRGSRVDLHATPIRITRPDGSVEARNLARDGAEPTRWTGTVDAALPGEYSVRVDLPIHSDGSPGARLESSLTVRDTDVEMIPAAPRRHDLEAISAATGGRVWPMDGCDGFVEFLAQDRVARAGSRRFDPMWDSPWMFAAIVSLLCGEWWLRRRGGLS